jgi:hypothetical protein
MVESVGFGTPLVKNLKVPHKSMSTKIQNCFEIVVPPYLIADNF